MREPVTYHPRDSVLFDGAHDAEYVALDGELDWDLREYWSTVRKHLGLVLAIPLIIAGLTFLHDLFATSLYTAESTILIHSNAPKIFEHGSVGPGPDAEPETSGDSGSFQKTEYELLRSRSLAAKVISAENLQSDPAFTGITRPILPGVNPSKPISKMPVDQALVATYLADLKVTPVEATELVKIAFTTRNPDLSARLANTHVREFIREGIELNAQASEEAEKFLEQKLVELKQQMELSETALNDYRRAHDIIPGLISVNGKQDVVIGRLNSLSGSLQGAHLKSIEVGAEVALIDEGRLNSLPEVIGSGLIQQLKGELDGLQAQYSSMASEVKPDYPPMHELQVKIDKLSELLHQEIANVATSIRSQYSAALNREKVLEQEFDRQKKLALGLNDSVVRYAILERDADTNRQLYNVVLKRLKDVSIVAGVHASNISIVDPAVPPRLASSPRKLLDLALAGTFGLILGIGSAFLMERLDNTLKTPSEAQKYLRLPNLGVIPQWRGLIRRSVSASRPIRFGHSGPASGKQIVAYDKYSFAIESYRSLRASLLLSRTNAPPKSIVITSTDAGEGKTVTAVNTAIVLAHASSKVLLADADLRRPACHKLLSIRNDEGLTEILADARDPGELIQPTHIPGMSLLSAGQVPTNAAELLASKRMKQILADLESQYDFIVIDTPPLLPVSDALLLGSIADGVVLVVEAAATPKQQVREVVARLDHAGVRIFGTLLNKVKLDKTGYSDYGSRYYRQPYGADDQEDVVATDAHA